MQRKRVEKERAEKEKRPKSNPKTKRPQTPQPQPPQQQMNGNVFQDAVVNAVSDTIRNNQLHQKPAPPQPRQIRAHYDSEVSELTGRGKMKGSKYVPRVQTADFNRPLNYRPLHLRFRDAN